MSRRDGFPTNREYQVDFTYKARDIYVAAAEHQLEAKIPDALKDKPLSFVELIATRKNRLRLEDDRAIVTEKLYIAPLSPPTAEMLSHNELFERSETYVIDQYIQLAHTMASTALIDTVRFGETIPGNGVEAEYTATSTNGRSRSAGTFRERASKQSLVAANYFADEVIEYLKSEEGKTPISRRKDDHIVSLINGESSDFPHQIKHYFTLPIRIGIPLNGYESPQYLQTLAAEMDKFVTIRTNRLERIRALGAPGILIEHENRMIKEAQATLDDARRYLGK